MDNTEKTARDLEDNPFWKLYLKGQVTWNKWARNQFSGDQLAELESQVGELSQDMIDFSHAVFLESVTFSGFVFPYQSNFEGATFTKDANFEGAIFTKGANFSGAAFTERANFRGATFTKDANFDNATFTTTADFSGAIFTKIAFFGRATFTMGAYFMRATFTEGTYFGEVTFTEIAYFSGAIFTKISNFSGATFTEGAYFDKATFTETVNFDKATFTTTADFNSCKFNSSTTFNYTTFGIAPKFHGADLHQDTSFHQAIFLHADYHGTDDVSRAWRTLKVFMNTNHHHQKEHEFFGYEMDAMRKQLSWKSPTQLSESILIGLYRLISNYGYSYGRPFLFLCVFTAFFAAAYFQFTDDWKQALNLSFASTIPFAGLSSAVLKASTLTGTYPLLINIAQSVINITLLFLMGLGLRNRFRIK